MPVKPIPDGYHTVTPYLILEDAPAFIEFAKAALGATERTRHLGGDGRIMHAEIQIGDSVVMLGDASEAFQARPAMLHLYIEDVDAGYKRATEAGAISVREPADQEYGDRSAGVRDRWGNEWWLATHIKDVAFA
jgi:uncharacterized glyoxalase superfamily protein PhnB